MLTIPIDSKPTAFKYRMSEFMTLSEQAQQAIDAEEVVLATIVEQLNQQLSHARKKLGQESMLARDLTAQIVAAQQAEDKQLLASDEAVAHALSKMKISDIDVLEKLVDQPYFGRVLIEEKLEDGSTKQFDYKIGKAANPDCRIIDWKKAPISKLYYEYQEGDHFTEVILGRERSGKILVRNSVEIKAGRLLGLSCQAGSFRLELGQWKQIKGALSARSFGNYQQLPDILALITPEQFELITSQAETALLIQGIAGSGKTSVALHRLAWLLSPGNSELKANDVLLLVPTLTLKTYVRLTLVALNVHNVNTLMVSQWLEQRAAAFLPQVMLSESTEIKRPETVFSTTSKRVFQSIALLKAIEDRAQAILQHELQQIQQSWHWDNLPPGLKSVFDSTSLKATSIGFLWVELLAAVQRGLASLNSNHRFFDALYTLKNDLNEKMSSLNIVDLLVASLSDPSAVQKHDRSKLLSTDMINTAKHELQENLDDNTLNICLDALIVCTATALGLTGRTGKLSLLRHIFVDEVQDLTAAELACVISAVKHSKDLTLAGDIAQQTRTEVEFTNWQETTNLLGLADEATRLVSLNVSHRSTREIMALADFIQERSLSATGRSGKAPIHFLCENENKAINAGIRWLEIANEKHPNSLSLVVCIGAKEARQMFSIISPTFGGAARLLDGNDLSPAGIVIGYPAQIKGLEFFNVLIFDSSRDNYPNNEFGRNQLYTNITRAEENLCIINWRQPSPLLPDNSKRLLRIMRLN